MAVQLISAAQALQNLDNFSVVIDARSEDEQDFVGLVQSN